MTFGGISGGFPGSAVCQRPSNRKIRALFVMLWITAICVYNILRFSGLAVGCIFEGLCL